MKRRSFIKKTVYGLGATAVLSGLYAWQIEPFWLEFVTLKMPLKNLPDELAGKTLMQISDIHIGKRFDYHFIIDSFKEAQKFNPDFVAYTGDYISANGDEIQYAQLQEVLTTAIKGKLGTVAILGNHDYGKNWQQQEVADKVTNMLTKNGITVLRNQSIAINNLHFTGIDDYWGVNFKPEDAFKDFNPANANIALCHNPDVCDLNIWQEYNSWILSGHTHGGQCKPPFLPAPMLPVKNRKYSAGKFALDNNRTLYINRALGHLWQIRFNVRPEITIFQLEKV